jgi:hypothetical protein
LPRFAGSLGFALLTASLRGRVGLARRGHTV